MEKLPKWISALAPFLAPYPGWVKAIFAVWVGLGAVLLVALVLARQADRSMVPGGEASGDARPGAPGNATDLRPGSPAAAETQLWLVVERLDFFAAAPGAQVQVTATVNGTEYVYPSREGVEWLEVGPSMASQRFRLPPTSDFYEISFKAAVRVPRADPLTWQTGQLTSVDQDIIRIPSQLPHTGRFVLHTFDPVHRARGASADAQVIYRIAADPD